jgi:predicted RNase H-like HicB family nuclease
MPLFRAEPFTIRIDANIPWKAAQDQETGVWVGVCEPLNLNAAGDTYWELLECMNETMALLLADLFESGEFEQFLRKNGWQSSPLPVRGGRVRFDIPFTTQRTNSPRDLVAMN